MGKKGGFLTQKSSFFISKKGVFDLKKGFFWVSTLDVRAIRFDSGEITLDVRVPKLDLLIKAQDIIIYFTYKWCMICVRIS